MKRRKPKKIYNHIASRELSSFYVRKRPILDELVSNFDQIGGLVPQRNFTQLIPFSLSFCKTSKYSHILAVSDEQGYMSLFDTREKFLPNDTFQQYAVKAKICEWVSHYENPEFNTIFDVGWIKDDTQILTASADDTVKIWDIEEKKCLGVLRGHRDWIQSISCHPVNDDIIFSGSRDGSFRLWDLRCNSSKGGEVSISSTAVVERAHLYFGYEQMLKVGIASVLCLKDQVTIVTAGDQDNMLKFWDTRYLRNDFRNLHPPHHRQQTTKEPIIGVSSLSQDDGGVFLSASCLDNKIYLYDIHQLEEGPLRCFSGAECKIEPGVMSAISPDALHLVSGSFSGITYLWEVNKPQDQPSILSRDMGDLDYTTAVNWSCSEFGKLATAANSTVRIWTEEYTRIAEQHDGE